MLSFLICLFLQQTENPDLKKWDSIIGKKAEVVRKQYPALRIIPETKLNEVYAVVDNKGIIVSIGVVTEEKIISKMPSK